MGDTSETNTKVLSQELFLGVVALKCLYLKIIICATRTLFSGTVTYINYIPPQLSVHFSMTRSVRYQPIFNTLYYTLHTEHAYCLSYRFLNNVVIPTVIEMVELVEILDRRLGKRSVERVRYVINNLLHLVIVSLLVKYLIIFHADPCNKSYISREISIEHPSSISWAVKFAILE